MADYEGVYRTRADQAALRNVIAASYGDPVHFGALSILHGNMLVTGGAKVGANTRDSAGGALTVTSNPTFDVATLETQTFTAGILQPIDPKYIKWFLDSGMDARLVMFLFISALRVDRNPIIQNSPESIRFVCYPGVAQLQPGHIYRDYLIVQQDQLSDCRSAHEPEFFAFARIVNHLGPMFANSYVIETPLAKSVQLDKSDIKDITTMDQTRYRVIPGASGKVTLVSLSPEKVALCEVHNGGPEETMLLNDASSPVCTLHAVPASLVPDESQRNIGARLKILSDINVRSTSGMFSYLGRLLAYERQRHRCVTLSFSGIRGIRVKQMLFSM